MRWGVGHRTKPLLGSNGPAPLSGCGSGRAGQPAGRGRTRSPDAWRVSDRPRRAVQWPRWLRPAKRHGRPPGDL